MRFESYMITELLQHLEQRGPVLHSQLIDAVGAIERDQYAEALDAVAKLQSMLQVIISTRSVLREQIIGDGIGEVGDSLEEIGLRARGVVILAQLDRLRDAFRDPMVRGRTAAWFLGEIQTIDDLAALVHERLRKIHAIWMPYRRGYPQSRGLSHGDQVAMFRIKMRMAQRALHDLGDEPEVAHFLRHAVAASGIPEVHLAAKQLVDALAVPLDEPGARRLAQPPRYLLTANTNTSGT